MDSYIGSTQCCGTDGSEEMSGREPVKEYWINQEDLIREVKKRATPSHVCEEKLLTFKDLQRAFTACRMMETWTRETSV